MKSKIIEIDKNFLPVDEKVSMDIIFDYFSDQEIEIEETNAHYRLRITRSDFLYCENMENSLKGLGINKKKVKDFRIVEQNSIFCLLESWIPYGWSKFIAENSKLTDNLTIIHLDDHADLMSPRISVNNGKWKDMLTGDEVSFSEPESIKKAIQSGAITIGSMMTPLIHYIKNVNLFHFKQNVDSISRYIEKTTELDSLFCLGKKRLAVKLVTRPKNLRERNNTYLRTSRLSELIENIKPNTDIFLHIDMDFFNNRFNGSTDWRIFAAKNNLNMDKQKEIMDDLCRQIFEAGLGSRIKHVSIGISPSFYPCEYWKEGVSYLLCRLHSVGVKVGELMKKLKLNTDS
ncbi:MULTISPECIES: hypothetical protein [Pelosinus]|uniref:Uncharacterized protein n=1 Tax=Pelosinus fermentans B4 TaxID=1149862 RepID=I8RIB0_9FIRM|nr:MULTISPECIES: hypothetical protein [Pelosinus]EIW19583.1 hypothetical protein FB4_2766 [Pelosinus fermentans B4]EIW24684.1 hypothetical protein FA11_3075 [Pelosinus fermentans A11]OAM96036.1 hypothetical protein FR7_04058 [Pelosinus fermentans DSM 17108]SDR35624.1 hypothetical protein SAMN04515679_4226 [Pelosinus fermentans]